MIRRVWKGERRDSALHFLKGHFDYYIKKGCGQPAWEPRDLLEVIQARDGDKDGSGERLKIAGVLGTKP